MRRCLSFLIALVVLAAAACKEGDVRITGLTFIGNKAVTSSALMAILATRSSGKLPWSPKHYFDRTEFEGDIQRVQAFYQDRGYPDARITNVDTEFNSKRDEVKLRVTIDEGEPVVLGSINLAGVDQLTLDKDVRGALTQWPMKTGSPRDKQLVNGAKDRVLALLKDNGYAHAQVRVGETLDGRTSNITYTVDAGPLTYFGDVAIAGEKSVGERVIRRQLTFRRGGLFRQRQLTESQRLLSGLELFEFVHVVPRTDEQAPTIPVTVTLAEGKPRRLQISAGYGSEEKVRAGVQWRHLNFFGGARTATAEVKYSSLDKGGRFSLGAPSLLRPGVSVLATFNAWHTDDRTYTSDTFGGEITLADERTNRRGNGVNERTTRRSNRFGYVNEYLRYRVNDDALADLTNTGELLSLGLDPVTGKGKGTRAALQLDLERSDVDVPADPETGYIASIHAEQAATWLGGTFSYRELSGEGRAYIRLTSGHTMLAVRAHAGSIFASGDSDVPFSQRYFLGGSSSVRGWGRYEISPLSADGIPVGGRRMAEFSTEIRAPLPVLDKLFGVVFFDAGNVWSEGRQTFASLRTAVGGGLRYGTAIGAVRVDVGYQLNPIDGLRVNGELQPRRWRIHFSLGQAF